LIPLRLIKTNGIGAIYLAQIILFFSYGGVGKSYLACRTFTDRARIDLQSYHRILDPDKGL
jgi:hypothetical protein